MKSSILIILNIILIIKHIRSDVFTITELADEQKMFQEIGAYSMDYYESFDSNVRTYECENKYYFGLFDMKIYFERVSILGIPIAKNLRFYLEVLVLDMTANDTISIIFSNWSVQIPSTSSYILSKTKLKCSWFTTAELYKISIPFVDLTYYDFYVYASSKILNSPARFAIRNFQLQYEPTSSSLCYLSCNTCYNFSKSSCVECDTKNNRILVNSQCVCRDGYFDSHAYCYQDFAPCSATCTKCQSFSRQCLSCNQTQNRVLKDGKCICKEGFYQKLNLYPCQPCDYTCKTCLSHSQRCLICADLRVKDANGNCVCKTGHFEKEGTCQPCGKWCDICINENKCTQCQFQFTNIISGVCQCFDGYYQSPVTGQCLQCSQGCFKCTSGSNCTDCKNTYLLLNGYCKCIEGQFDNGTQCLACNNRCATCSSISKCDSCQNLPNLILSNGNCICKDGNYEDGFLQCQACNEKCSTCFNSSKCQTCIYPDKFILDQQSMCNCRDGMYEVSTPSKNCLSCNEKCTKCTNKDVCTDCKKNSGLILVESQQMCICKQSNEYFNSTEQICKPCQKNCSQCTSYNACQKCINDIEYDYNPTKQSCDCKLGYYIDQFEDKDKELCTQCHFTCKSCSYFNICTECNIQGAILDSGQCLCPIGQYLNLSGPPKCDKCLPSCKTCNNSQTCSKCANDVEYNPIDIYGNCNCKKGYYQKDYLCYKCPDICSECTSEYQCTECIQSMMKLLNGTCSCPDMYFYDSLQKQCTLCPKYCQSCTDSKTCTSCTDMEAFQIINGLCVCKTEGYFEKPDGSCSPCEYTCKQCIDSTSCLSCKYKFLSTSQCTCGEGLNFDRVTNECNKCHQGCKVCNSILECSLCSDNISFELDIKEKQCKCRIGYYKDSNSKCSKCSKMCSMCEDDKDKCTGCAFKDTQLVNNKCICKEDKSYFDEKSQQCQKCSKFCQSCNNSETCNSCLDTIKYEYVQQTMQCRCASNYYISFLDGFCIQCLKPNLIHENIYCVQTCPENYSVYQNYCVKECPFLYVSINRICTRTQCDSKCKKCNSDYINCDNCIQGHYLMKDNSCQFCDMQIQYYNQTEKVCGMCDQACDKCSGSTAFDCIQCKFAQSEKLGGQCVLQCDKGEYPFLIKNKKVCKTCFSHEGVCFQDKCNEGHYKDKGNVCIKCHSTCLECSGPKSSQCIVCVGDLNFEQGKCLVCTYGFYFNQTLNKCSECHLSCKECTGPEQNQCKSCSVSLVHSKISGKCVKKEEYQVEIDQKQQADSIGCDSDDFEVCKQQINFSKQTSSVLNTISVSSACFNSVVGMIMQGIGLQSWVYIQNHQLLGNLKYSNKVISLGIIKNHIKISNYYNIVTFFQSDDDQSSQKNYIQEYEYKKSEVQRDLSRILDYDYSKQSQNQNDKKQIDQNQKYYIDQNLSNDLMKESILMFKQQDSINQNIMKINIEQNKLGLSQSLILQQNENRVLPQILEDDVSQEKPTKQAMKERYYFQDKCYIQLIIIGSLHIIILLCYFASSKIQFAKKVLLFVKWNVVIRLYMLCSNFILKAAIEEILFFDFSNLKAILSFSEATTFLSLYFVLYIFAFKFLFSSNGFADEALRINYSVLFIQLKVEFKLQRIYWILFEIKKLCIILIQIFFKDNEVLQVQIILGISATFFLYLIIMRPFNSLLLFICCILIEFVNIFFIVNLMLLFQDPGNVSLSTRGVFITFIRTLLSYFRLLIKIVSYSFFKVKYDEPVIFLFFFINQFIYFLFGYEGLVCALSLIQIIVKLIDIIKARRMQKLKEKQDSSQIQLMGFKIDVNIDQFLNSIPVKSVKGSTKLVLKAKYMEMEKR